MRPLLKFALFLSAFLLCKGVYAQISDSLYKVLPLNIKPVDPKFLSDKEKRTLLTNVRLLPHAFFNELTALAQQLIKATDKNPDWEEKILNTQGVAEFYLILNEFEGFLSSTRIQNEISALNYYQKSIEYAGKISEYQHYVSDAYRFIGILYFRKDIYDSAAVYCTKSLDVCRQQKDNLGAFKAYCLLGDIYMVMDLIEKALYTNNLAFEVLGNKWDADFVDRYYFKMRCYKNLYENTKIERYADSVKTFAKDLFNHITKESYYYYRTYDVLSRLYYAQGNYKKALVYIDSSLTGWNRDKRPENLSGQYFMKDIYLIMLGHTERGMRLLDSLPYKSYNNRQMVYEALYKQAANVKNWEKAFLYYEEYKKVQDSMKIDDVNGLLFEAEQKYAIAEKQARITALENKGLLREKQQSKLITTGIAAGLVLLLAIIVLIGMYRYAQVKRHSEKQLLTAELYNMEAAIHEERQQQLENITAQRKKIAEDMHDEVSSGLAAFRFYIIDLKAKAKTAETTKMLSELETEAQVLYQQARDFMKNLNASKPASSYNVYELAEQLSARFNNQEVLVIKNNIDRKGVEEYFTGSMHYELYLVIKEAIANSIKHAGASLVDIGIYFKNHTCFFAINDNGRGFNVEAVTSDGLGLKSIANRVQTISGNLQIRSNNKGTIIEGFFPV